VDLQELRKQIDAVDDEIIRLFVRRMEISIDIAEYKGLRGMPVYDPERERLKLESLTAKVSENNKAGVSALFALLFELSRNEQERILGSRGAASDPEESDLFELSRNEQECVLGSRGAASGPEESDLFELSRNEQERILGSRGAASGPEGRDL